MLLHWGLVEVEGVVVEVGTRLTRSVHGSALREGLGITHIIYTANSLNRAIYLEFKIKVRKTQIKGI